jgi:hypothetical protein
LTSDPRLRVEVLCKDSEHEAFARSLFKRWFGIDRRRFRVAKAPKGKGAASQWVASQFPELARRARATRHQAKLGFLAIVDGDSAGAAARKAGFLSRAPRSSDDRVAIWAPTWEVETWVLWLSECKVGGQDVDESRSFKTELPPEELRSLLDAAVDKWNEPRSDEASRMPSIADARSELQRIFK